MDETHPTDRLVITDVQTQRRRAERRSIFINGAFAFGCSEETYVKYSLFRGREVTQEFLDEVAAAETEYQARQVAMRFVGRRLRSRSEIEKKLAERAFAPDVIARTLAFLAEYGLVNDDQFARAYVNDQLLRRPVGRRRLEQELQRKGVPRDSARTTVTDLLDDDVELRNATDAARKRTATMRQTDPARRDRALATFLASRGFGWETIGQVLRNLREPGVSPTSDEEMP